jgi:flagellar hook-length control protein FliK
MTQMNVIHATQVTQQSKSSQETNKSENSGFLHLFKHALTETEVHQTFEAPKDEIETTDLHTLILQLINKDQVNDENILSNPNAEELLKQLPFVLQMEIEEIFNADSNNFNFLEDGQDYMQNPAMLMALVIRFSTTTNEDLRTSKQTSLESSVIQRLLVQLDKALSEVGKDLNLNALKGSQNREEFILSAFIRSSSVNEKAVTQVVAPTIQGLPMNQVHQFALHVGGNLTEQQNAEKFLRQFHNILGKSSLVQFPNGLNKLTIKLFPQHLGRLDITLTQQNGVIIAQLMTTTKAAKSALDTQLHQLRQAFIGLNVQVEKLEVVTQQQHQSLQQSDKENQQGKNNSQQNKRQDEEDNVDDKIKFEDFLNGTFDEEV